VASVLDAISAEDIQEKILAHRRNKLTQEELNDPEKIKEKLSRPVIDQIEQSGWADELNVYHKYYWLGLHTLEQLKEVCLHLRLPKSGTKPVKCTQILEYHMQPWSSVEGNLSEFEYTGESEEGPSEELKNSLPDTFDVFLLRQHWWPDETLQKLVLYTNKKAETLLALSSAPAWYKYEIWPPKFLQTWKDVDLPEFKLFWAVFVAKNALARGASITEIWKTKSLIDYSKIASVMSRDRWKAIASCFCIYDPEDERTRTNGPPHWKADDLISDFCNRCKKNYFPGRFVSRDEQCICNHHRTALRHRGMKKKFVVIGLRMEAMTTTKGVFVALCY
jgi:hypothetical protein